LARELPFPLDCGDKIYSANLAKALAEAGADLTLVGLRPDQDCEIPGTWPIRWSVVAGRRNSTPRALLSRMPLVAAAYATPSYRDRLKDLVREPWDFVILDQYGMGWALAPFLAQRRRWAAPLMVYVAHNHETSVAESLLKHFKGSLVQRIGIWQNYRKTRAFEHSLLRNVDVVTAITEEDASRFAATVPSLKALVLKPGYACQLSARTAISHDTPRKVVMIGSFRWLPKQENLRNFVALADPIFAEHGIEFHVIGSVFPTLRSKLEKTSRATTFHGFIEDVQPHLQSARIAVVPEVVGGGFKLKFLDYIFGGVPVATLCTAVSGLPASLQSAMLRCADSKSLAMGICELIDDVERLTQMQSLAFAQAQALFRWEDRGNALLLSIMEGNNNVLS